MASKESCIAVFDSGVGGISVLRELVKSMPQEKFLYFGDSANAPYGTRPIEEIRQLCANAIDHLLAQGIKALVIACNTATAAYAAFAEPVALEEIRADAGLDIGLTLIGMHLKKVAVPLRLEHRHIGEALIVAARTRPKFIGGSRAVYDTDQR